MKLNKDDLKKELKIKDKKKAELIELIFNYVTEKKMSSKELEECLDIVKFFTLLKKN